MGIRISDGFKLNAPRPLDERDSFDTLEQMKNFDMTSIDEGHISFCKETKKMYQFLSSNDYDEDTGRWKEYLGDYYTKQQIDDVVANFSISGVAPDTKELEKQVLKNSESLQSLQTNINTLKNAIDNISVGGAGITNNVKSITITKTKTTYEQSETISLDDLVVTAYYDDNTSKVVDNYITNIDQIDTDYPGYHELEVVYIYNNRIITNYIGLNVKFTESSDSTQYAFITNKTGILTDGISVVKLLNRLYKLSKISVRLKADIIIEQNYANSEFNLGFNNKTIWGNNPASLLKIQPGQIGKFTIDIDFDTTINNHDLNKDDISSISLFNLINEAGTKVHGYYEIKKCSVALTEEVKSEPEKLTATLSNNRTIIGENYVAEQIQATVTYTNLATSNVSSKVTSNISAIVDSLIEGDNKVTVSYSEDGKTVTTTVNIIAYKEELTEATKMPFTRMTAREYCEAWKVGVNFGNILDSRANSTRTIPGDTTHKGDAYLTTQETAWGQPAITKELIQQYVDRGFKMVRLPVSWAYNSYTEEERDTDGLKIRHVGKFYLARVRQVIDWLLEAGMYVVLNMHHEESMWWTNGTNQEMKQIYKDVYNCWFEIASKFKWHDQRLSFSPFNEMDNAKASWQFDNTAADHMNIMNQKFYDAVIASGGYNKDRVIMLPQLLHGAATEYVNKWQIPDGLAHDITIYDTHGYNSNLFQDLEPTLSGVEKRIEKFGVPIVYSECGNENIKANTISWRTMQARNFSARCRPHNIYPIVWDDGGSFGLFNRHNYNPVYAKQWRLDGPDEELRPMCDAYVNAFRDMKAYCIPDEYIKVISSANDINRMAWTPARGHYDSGWGHITLKEPMPVIAGKKLKVEYVGAMEGSSTLNLTNIFFLKKDGDEYNQILNQVVSQQDGSTWTNKKEMIVPEDSTHIMVQFNSPNVNLTTAQIVERLEKLGDTIQIFQYDDSDIEVDQLKIREPISINVSSDKLMYAAGDTIDLDTIVSEVLYDDGWVRTMPNYYLIGTFSYNTDLIDMSTEGLKNVVVTYTEGEKSVQGTLVISVGMNPIALSAVKGNISLLLNKEVDLSDLTVTLTYPDGTSVNTSEYTTNVSGLDNTTEGEQTLVIMYNKNGVTLTDSVQVTFVDLHESIFGFNGYINSELPASGSVKANANLKLNTLDDCISLMLNINADDVAAYMDKEVVDVFNENSGIYETILGITAKNSKIVNKEYNPPLGTSYIAITNTKALSIGVTTDGTFRIGETSTNVPASVGYHEVKVINNRITDTVTVFIDNQLIFIKSSSVADYSIAKPSTTDGLMRFAINRYSQGNAGLTRMTFKAYTTNPVVSDDSAELVTKVIGISATKTTTTYEVGSNITYDDIIVVKNNNDRTSVNITDFTVDSSAVNNLSVGEQKITVSYTENDETFTAEITINVVSTYKLEVTMSKVEYNVGEAIDISDLDVGLVNTDTKENTTITNYTTNITSIDITSPGEKNLEITYTNNGVTYKAIVKIRFIKVSVYEWDGSTEDFSSFLKASTVRVRSEDITLETESYQDDEGTTKYQIRRPSSYIYDDPSIYLTVDPDKVSRNASSYTFETDVILTNAVITAQWIPIDIDARIGNDNKVCKTQFREGSVMYDANYSLRKWLNKGESDFNSLNAGLYKIKTEVDNTTETVNTYINDELIRTFTFDAIKTTNNTALDSIAYIIFSFAAARGVAKVRRIKLSVIE